MKELSAAVNLTRELIRMNTVNPPGNERDSALFLGGILERAGFSIQRSEFSPGRVNLIARLPGTGEGLPLCLCGHLDTVPLGSVPWNFDPFSAEIVDGKIYGRGSSDMKGGVAAIVTAAVRAASKGPLRNGVTVILTAGEETGCLGARHLAESAGLLHPVSALIVAEPTGNYPALGHKGALWLEAAARGVAAHGSMPEHGVNAVYKIARAVSKLETFDFETAPHPVLGCPTLNVGTISGGTNVNIVPDRAEIGIDIRTIPEMSVPKLLENLSRLLGHEIELRAMGCASGVFTDPEHPWVKKAFEVVGKFLRREITPASVPYFTDASSLSPALDNHPILILGPGEAALAHQTDEYCSMDKIDRAAAIYEAFIRM